MSDPRQEDVEALASFGIKFYQDRRKRRFRLVKANFGHDAYKDQDLLASVAAMILEAKSEKSSG